MATAEGTFPKIGNDPIYASEANSFRPKAVGMTDSITVTSNEGDYQVGGSIYYSGTYPSLMSDLMMVSAQMETPNFNGQKGLQFRFSGLEFDFIKGTIELDMDHDAAATTPILSSQYMLTSGTYVSEGGTNFGSPFVIFVEPKTGSKTSAGNTTLRNFMVWCE